MLETRKRKTFPTIQRSLGFDERIFGPQDTQIHADDITKGPGLYLRYLRASSGRANGKSENRNGMTTAWPWQASRNVIPTEGRDGLSGGICLCEIPNSEFRIQKRTPSAGRWVAEGVEWSPGRCPETENRGFAV